jgi:DnaJ like chaperone protein
MVLNVMFFVIVSKILMRTHLAVVSPIRYDAPLNILIRGKILGKWIGAVVGLIGGFPGAIIGFFVGAFFDAMFSDSPTVASRRHQAEHQQVFFKTLFELLGHLAKADGRISEAEVKATEGIMTRMGLDAAKRALAIQYFKQGSEPTFNLDVALNNFRLGPGRSRQMRQFLIVTLITVGMADGQIDQTEMNLLQRIASGVGISNMQLQQLIMMLEAQHNFFNGQYRGHSYSGGGQQHYQQQSSASELATAYKALGIEASATDAEVKKAYRGLMKEYHPDKLIAKGLPEDMVKVATERAQEVQVAYDLVMKQRKK